MILKNYAPVAESYGFHFKNYDTNIFTPVIRDQIRNAKTKKLGHYTVYLPAYGDDRIIKVLGEIKEIRWEVFSKHAKTEKRTKNIVIKPINNELFINSFLSCTGILCGAGFETPAEALFLKKKLLVIPMKGQYEQQCNAASLKEMGVPVIKSLKLKHLEKIDNWIKTSQNIPVSYENDTEKILDNIIAKHKYQKSKSVIALGNNTESYKKLKGKIFNKIIAGISKA